MDDGYECPRMGIANFDGGVELLRERLNYARAQTRQRLFRPSAGFNDWIFASQPRLRERALPLVAR